MRISPPAEGEHFGRMAIWLIMPTLVAVLVAALLYSIVSNYLIHQAEESIQNVILTHRGLHQYIQRVMHPQLFAAQKSDDISLSYYRPELFSSSYMVRVVHGFYNEEREKFGLEKIYYKMAADNPRNPVNRADAMESELLQYFNKHREVKEYRATRIIDGKKYLVYAIPFLETTQACLRCHDQREDAPLGLQALYPGEGGFHDKVGNIRAIESIRAPLDSQFFSAGIVTGSVFAGGLALGCLALFNSSLSREVKRRTEELAEEITERRNAENEVRKLNLTLENKVAERTERLERANGELDVFTYSVSHDLRAPLRHVNGFAAILKEDYRDAFDDTGRDILDRICAASSHMGKMIEDLLRLSKVSRTEMKKVTVDLTQCARKISTMFHESDPERTLSFDIAEDLVAQGGPLCTGDGSAKPHRQRLEIFVHNPRRGHHVRPDLDRGPTGLLCQGQRRRLRHGLPKQTVLCF
jgi:Protein of unknown function (DUF3365)/His Kinase A (phospho-acceptor) domain